jgi:uncharacterized protein
MPPAPDLSRMSLAEVAQALAEQRLPPVDQWHPTHCGDSEMRIARDGTWYHQGSLIGREAMVRLFSTILRREADGSYVLVTPGEKLDILVEDAPFIAVEVKSEGAGKTRKLTFRLNTADLVVAGADHALRFTDTPYIHVRGGMDARIARPVYYELANLALDEASEPNGLWSNGIFFPMAAA